MSAFQSPEQSRAMHDAFAEGLAAPRTLREKWEALHETAQLIGTMAQLAHEDYKGELAAFPNAIVLAGPTKHELAEQGLQDMDAIIQPGVTALLAIEARGQDTTAPALALWREFHAARQSMLAMCAPADLRSSE
ncbi:MAG: hypothetical protein ABJ239_05440 [Erythrobacter sp.]